LHLVDDRSVSAGSLSSAKLAGVEMIKRWRAINGKLSTERALFIGTEGITRAETSSNVIPM